MAPLTALLAAHPTVGHTGALRAMAAELRARGHRAAFALVHAQVPFAGRWPEPVRAAAQLPSLLASDGNTVLPLRPSLRALWHAVRLPLATGQQELALAISLFTAGMAGQAREIAAHCHAVGADVVVGDYLMPAALLGATLAGRPYVAVYHSALPFPAEGAPPFGTLLPESTRGSAEWTLATERAEALGSAFGAQVSRAAAQLGVAPVPVDLVRTPVSKSLNILATAQELEPGLLPLQGPVVMTGPCLPRPAPSTGDVGALLAGLPAGRPTVYVSLGTVFNSKPTVYRVLVRGAQAAGANVLVSAGASLESLGDLAGTGVVLQRRVPQLEVLRHVDAVITHGGNNTVQECLSAGRPLVVLPFGGDQAANAHRVVRLGVGVRLDAAGLEQAAVAEALRVALSPPLRERGNALARALSGYGGTAAAVDALLDVVERARD